MKIIFASNNPKKIEDTKEFLKDLGIEVVSLSEIGLNIEIEEIGKTYAENAVIKCNAVHDALFKTEEDVNQLIRSDYFILADDSGIEIDALPGKLGLYSKRYLGEETSFDDKCENILKELKDVPVEKRGFKHVCSAYLLFPDNTSLSIERYHYGTIATEKHCPANISFECICIPLGHSKSLEELPREKRNKIIDRHEALEFIKPYIKEYLKYKDCYQVSNKED